MTFSAEEGTNYLLVALCSLLVIVLSLILCGIPCRTFPRSHATRLPPTSPSFPSPASSQNARTPSTPAPSQNAPLDLPPFIPPIHPVTPMPPYPTQPSPYRAPTFTPQSPQTPQTPKSSPPRFVINTNQNFADSQRLRGPKF